jgi:DNA-binding GntR family transcriptional regulator
MTPRADPPQHKTAQHKVLEHVRRGIARGEYTPGQPIRADAVAAELDLSRIPVREALRVLEAEGLVVSRPHRDVTVAELGAADLHEIYMLRRMLESTALRTAVPALSQDTLEALETLLGEMQDAIDEGDNSVFADVNRRFHFTLYEASGLRHLTKLIGLLWNQSEGYRSIYLIENEELGHLQEEHRAIVRACQARDVERAIQVLDQHRERSEATIDQLLDRAREGRPT